MAIATYKLYDRLLSIYKTQYNKLSQDQNKMINGLNRSENLPLNFIEDDLPSMPPLEGDEEPEQTISERVKLNPRKEKNEGTGLKVLSPNKLSTRLPILLAQIKTGNSLYKLKN